MITDFCYDSVRLYKISKTGIYTYKELMFGNLKTCAIFPYRIYIRWKYNRFRRLMDNVSDNVDTLAIIIDKAMIVTDKLEKERQEEIKKYEGDNDEIV